MNNSNDTEVWIWLLDGSAAEAGSDSYWADLTPAECDRARKLIHTELRAGFIFRRSQLRRVLGSVTGLHPTALSFEYNAFGKPAVRLPTGAKLHFSQASSRDRTLIAVSRKHPVGVDMEPLSSSCCDRRVAERWFPKDWLAAMRDADCGDGSAFSEPFLTHWTRAEAILKASGCGLAALPRLAILAAEYTTLELEAGSMHMAALAVPGKRLPVVCRIPHITSQSHPQQ